MERGACTLKRIFYYDYLKSSNVVIFERKVVYDELFNSLTESLAWLFPNLSLIYLVKAFFIHPWLMYTQSLLSHDYGLRTNICAYYRCSLIAYGLRPFSILMCGYQLKVYIYTINFYKYEEYRQETTKF